MSSSLSCDFVTSIYRNLLNHTVPVEHLGPVYIEGFSFVPFPLIVTSHLHRNVEEVYENQYLNQNAVTKK